MKQQVTDLYYANDSYKSYYERTFNIITKKCTYLDPKGQWLFYSNVYPNKGIALLHNLLSIYRNTEMKFS